MILTMVHILILGAVDVSSAGEEARLVADYVQFHDFKRVYVIDGESGARESPEAAVWSPWCLQVFSLLAAPRTTFVSVLGCRELRGVTPAATAVNTSSQLDWPPEPSSELVVHRMLTRADQLLFLQIFQGRESRMSWLLVCGTEVPSFLSNIYFPLNNKAILATVSGDGSAASLWESYQVTRRLPRHTQQIGRWALATHLTDRGSDHQGGPETLTDEKTLEKSVRTFGDRLRDLHKTSGDLLHDLHTRKLKRLRIEKQVMRHGVLEAPRGDLLLTRDDFTGLHLVCTTIELKPFTLLTKQSDGSVLVTGIMGDVFTNLQEITNFTSRCHSSEDGGWGLLVEGQWTGLVREVVTGEADIIAAPLDITLQRSTAVDYLHGFVREGYKLVMRRPSTSDYMWTAYTRQFQPAVWIVMAATVVMLVGMKLVVVHFSERQGNRLSIADTFTMITGFLLGQGTSVRVEGTPGRTVVLSCLLLHVLLLAHYTSDLITALAAGPPLPSISSIDDINRNPSLHLGYVKSSAIGEYLKESSDQVLQKAHQVMEANNFKYVTGSFAEGMERVLSEPYIFLEWEVPILYTYGQDCRFYRLPTTYFSTQASFAIRKGSPLVPVLNTLLMDLQSSGILVMVERRWRYTGGHCQQLQGAPIELKTLFTVFLLLGVGMILSVFLLAGEIYIGQNLFLNHSKPSIRDLHPSGKHDSLPRQRHN